VSVYPSLEAAMAARPPAPVLARVAGMAASGTDGRAPPRRGQATEPLRAAEAPDGNGATIAPAVARNLVNALQDGVALADGDGVITLADTRLEEIFGYQYGELIGRTVESLIPAHLEETRRGHRASYVQAPRARPMGRRADARRAPGGRNHVPGRDQP
jgi:PAS domain S-box-containing protein